MFPPRINENIFFSIYSPALDSIDLLNFAIMMGENASFYDVPHKLGVFFFFAFLLFRATPMAYGGSQARDLIGATAAGLYHSHSNARS